MKRWIELINSFNNLVLIKFEGSTIFVSGTKFALRGLENKLSIVNKTLSYDTETTASFDRSIVGYTATELDQLFN